MTRHYDLPAPPSANALFRNWTPREIAMGRHIRKDGKKKQGRPRSERYGTWFNAAGWVLGRQKPERIAGPVNLTIELNEKSRLDLGNCEKGVTDLLVEHQVIEDDDKAIVRSITLRWSSDIPNGVRVFVEPFRDTERAREAA